MGRQRIRLVAPLLAFILVSPALHAQDDDPPDLNRAFEFIDGGQYKTRFGVRLIHNGSKVTGHRTDDTGKSNLEVLRGTLDGLKFSGTVRLHRVKNEATGESDPNVFTNDAWLKLTYDPKTGNLTGERDNPSYDPDKKTWRFSFRAAVSVRLEPTCRGLTEISLGNVGLSVPVTFSEPIHPLKRGTDEAAREGHCHFRESAIASLKIGTGDLAGSTAGGFAAEVTLSGCDIDFYLNEYAVPTNPARYPDVYVSWTDSESGQYPILERWGISFVVYSFSVHFTTGRDGALRIKEGFLDLRLAASRGARLFGPVYLGGGFSGIIRYRWKADAQSWSDGTWEFGGLNDLQLQVRQNGIVPVAVLDLNVQADGTAQGALTVNKEVEWAALGYTVQIETCTLRGRVNLRDESWAFEGGGLTGTIAARAPSDTAFRFSLDWQGDRFRMSIQNSGDLRIFGGVCRQLELAVDLDPNSLEFSRIEGRLKWLHSDFDAEIHIEQFLVEDGDLRKFEGGGEVGYRNFRLVIGRLLYENVPSASRLSVSATLDLGWGKAGVGSVDLRNFTIDEKGAISSFDLEASVAAAPINASLKAAFNGSRFDGEFRGNFAGAVGIKGSVVIGSKGQPEVPEPFRYGYLEMEVSLARGVPIGGGLSILALNGAFGFNYLPEGAIVQNPDKTTTIAPKGGVEKKDIFYLAGGITIGDMGGLASLNGTLALTLGSQSSLQISGTIQVTQPSPFFRGTLSCGYALGTPSIKGSLQSTVKIPLSGSVIDMDRNTLVYAMESDRWSLEGQGLGGTFFSFVTLSEGRVQMASSLSRPLDAMSGTLRARLGGGTNMGFEWKRLGFALKGGIRLRFDGVTDVRLDRHGTAGRFDMTVDFGGTLTISTPDLPFFGSVTGTYDVSARARLDAIKKDDTLFLSGNVRLLDTNGDAYEVDFKHAF